VKRTCACLIVLFVVACAPARAVLPEYVLRDLGDLGFGMPSAVDINELGQAVFTVVVGGDRFYLWDGSGLWEIQGVRGLGINDRGQVAATAPTLMQSYVWDGTLVELPLSRALDINNAGHLIGIINDPYGAWLYANDALSPLGDGVIPVAINNSDQIVGYVEINTVSRPIIWSGGSLQVLPFFGQGYGINDLGNIVGAGYIHGQLQPARAFYWDGNTIHDLGRGTPYDVNDRGRVVGSIGPSGAGVWEDGHVAALPSFGAGLNSLAFAINNDGVIAGTAEEGFGHWHLVLWEPVPEPGSLPTLAFGALSLAAVARRRCRR